MYFWIGAIILFLVFEFLTPNLTTIWFAVGAFCALVINLIFSNLTVEIIVFFITSFIALFLTRPLVKKYLKPNIKKTNYDRVIGMEGVVVKDVDTLEYGEVKVDGKIWTAKSSEKIKMGEKVIIKAIDGVKLIVVKKEK